MAIQKCVAHRPWAKNRNSGQLRTTRVNPAAVLLMGSGGKVRVVDPVDTYILEGGWAESTKRKYAAAVTKYNAFCSFFNKRVRLPMPREDVCNFIVWANSGLGGRTVNGKTARTYVTGLRMWHTLHDVDFPHVSKDRVRLALKAARKVDHSRAVAVEGRGPILLQSLSDLVRRARHSSDINAKAFAALVLVAFWGMARIGELVQDVDDLGRFIRCRDVCQTSYGLRITIWGAKTADVGK